jgi:hypothetical protein
MFRLVRLAVCFVAVLSTVVAFAQAPEAQTEENTTNTAAAPVAYVYVQTTPGVVVYSTAANGTLTEVKGSPFKVTGQMEDISGKFLISVGNTILRTYQIESNGAVGKQISQINTASYGGSECGGTSGQGSVVDHTGKYLYVQLNTLNKCAAWQTYRIESDGYLQFLGHVESYQLYDSPWDGTLVVASTVPTISSNDKFQYGIFDISAQAADFCPPSPGCPSFTAYKLSSGGMLEQNASFTEKDPVAEPGDLFIPWSWNSPRADGNGHLAVLMDEEYDSGGDYSDSRVRVASYTINSTTGALTSTNTHDKMPIVQVGWYSGDGTVPGPEKRNPDGNEDGGGGWYDSAPFAMAMSPAGNILAVGSPGGGGTAGIQLFHFNGAAEATAFGNEFYDWPIEQLMWDSKNHLYALDYALSQLAVFTVTTTSVKQAGSTYNLPKSAYGTKGMIVVSQ